MKSVTTFLTGIWARRSLIRTFAINDLRLRYRNSVLGFFWSVLEPLLMLSVLLFVFTNIFKSDVPYYELHLLLSLIIWGMVARGTSMGMGSILNRSGVVAKIYFPREIPAISASITSFIMMSLEFAILGGFMVAESFVPTASIVLLPPLLILLFIFVLGLSLPLSALNVYFRDVQYIWAVLLNAGYFLMPILYPLSIFPENTRMILSLNPLARLMEMAQNVTIKNVLPSGEDWLYVTMSAFLILATGYFMFNRLERRLAEEL